MKTISVKYDTFSFDDSWSQNSRPLVKYDRQILLGHEESYPRFFEPFLAIILLEFIAIVCKKNRCFPKFHLWWPLVTAIMTWSEITSVKVLDLVYLMPFILFFWYHGWLLKTPSATNWSVKVSLTTRETSITETYWWLLRRSVFLAFYPGCFFFCQNKLK